MGHQHHRLAFRTLILAAAFGLLQGWSLATDLAADSGGQTAAASEPEEQSVSAGAQLLARARALTGDDAPGLEAVKGEALQLFWSAEGVSAEQANGIIDEVQRVLLAGPGTELERRSAAVEFAREVDPYLRWLGIEFVLELLRSQRERASGTASEAYLRIEIATYLAYLGRWAEADREHVAVLNLFVPPGVALDAFTPQDPGALKQLAYWLNSRSSFLMDIGAVRAAAAHAAELARLVPLIEPADATFAFMACSTGMRTALGMERPEQVLRLMDAAEGATWIGDEGVAASVPYLELLRWIAASNSSRLQGTSTDAAERELRALIDSEASGPSVVWGASLSLAVLLVERGETSAAVDLLRGAPGTHEGDRGRMLLALELREARLAQELGQVAALRERAAAAFDELLTEWWDDGRHELGGGLLQLVQRSAFVGELLRAELTLHPGPLGLRGALELLMCTQPASGPEPCSVDDVLRALERPGCGFVVLVPSRLGTLALWGADGRSGSVELAAYDLLSAERATLDEAAVKALASNAGASRADLTTAVRAATAAFLPAELWSELRGVHELVVIGAEDFGWPSFELLEPDAEGPLGLRRALSYLSTLEEAHTLGPGWSVPPSTRGALAMVAPPSNAAPGGPDLPALPVGRTERGLLEQAASALGSSASRVVLGRDASLAALAGTAGKRWLSLTAHGAFDPFRIEPAGLWLAAGDGVERIWTEDIEALDAPEFVTLFACRAGVAPVLRGSGGGGHLADAFQGAGARAVALATTELEFRLSLELAAELGEQLDAGAPLAEALRAARAALAERSGGNAINALLVRLHGWGGDPLTGQSGGPGEARSRVPFALILGLGALGLAALVLRARGRSQA